MMEEQTAVTDETTDLDTDTPDPAETPSADESDGTTDESAGDPDVFSREYVEELRRENGKYRQRAQKADELAHRLHRALVRSDGRLQDPSDLPFSDDHLADDGDALTAAITELLERKPHLGARRPTGDVGQGAESGRQDVNLLGILRGN